MEGCWDYDCCIFVDADEDTLAQCDCQSTESASACEDRASATRGSKVVSECAPGAKRDLSRYAEEGERCDTGYLMDKDLWECTPGTECVSNDDNLRTCREAPEREVRGHANEGARCDAEYLSDRGLQACRPDTECLTNDENVQVCLEVSEEMLACRQARDAETPLQLAEPETIDAAVAAFTATQAAGTVDVNTLGCVIGLDLRFDTGSLVGCGLELVASIPDDSLDITRVVADMVTCDTETSTFAYVREEDPEKISFTVSKVFGETCDTGRERCLIGGVEVHVVGTVGELAFEETTLRVEGVFCSDTATKAGVCPSEGP